MPASNVMPLDESSRKRRTGCGSVKGMNVPARAGRAVIVASLLLLTACSSQLVGRTAVAASVTMANCGSGQQQRPRVVAIICNSNDITARDLKWSGWGESFAAARGRAVVDMCAFEDCHTGSYRAFRIVVIASKIAHCGKNRLHIQGCSTYLLAAHHSRACLPT